MSVRDDLFDAPPEAEAGPAEVAPILPGMEGLRPPLALPIAQPVWGMDPSTRRWALCILRQPAEHLGEPGTCAVTVYVADVPQEDGGARRLAAAYEALGDLFACARSAWGAPAYVVVEQPFARGNNVHPASQQILGVGLAACAAVLPDGIIETVDPAKWKGRALGAGRGHAGPPEYLAWAQDAVGLEDKCPHCSPADKKCARGHVAHDKAAAVGVATYAALHVINDTEWYRG